LVVLGITLVILSAGAWVWHVYYTAPDFLMIDSYLSSYDHALDGKLRTKLATLKSLKYVDKLVGHREHIVGPVGPVTSPASAVSREAHNKFCQNLGRAFRRHDPRAPSRFVFWCLASAALPDIADEPAHSFFRYYGKALAVQRIDGKELLQLGSLYIWWRSQGPAFPTFPLFEEWQGREHVREIVSALTDATEVATVSGEDASGAFTIHVLAQ
jgi:hypothetical protein